ncbi:2OG-Fe(II) oxygenase family protein [Amycolatopsis dendrobii]|uniref:2OG-Fe(II) oxygenase n=1 Tax=Amycolatopsis dendrobii TaxID=2760662 RepID=A0A7W3W5H9_9PSEU|nr:2OG-Fe(II) oxygenase [Amycolatopsis dendrobii]MBB1158672.1 2OG-Fe(II) oxygenase [Amycolatopsis dendrobii]
MWEAQRGKRFVVIDDFLDANTLAAARSMVRRTSFRAVDSVISPNADGPAFRSHGVHFTDGVPTGGGRPRTFEEIAAVVRRERALYGGWGTDWNRIGFTFWKYPAGSRLGWHNDAGGGRRGEFILFLHENWRPSWGGELMLLDAVSDIVNDVDELEPAARMEAVLDRCPLSPTAVLPRPNRLVLVQAATVHQIQRVDRTAGDNLRCTLTGFVSQDAVPGADRGAVRDKLLAALTGS